MLLLNLQKDTENVEALASEAPMCLQGSSQTMESKSEGNDPLDAQEHKRMVL